EVATTPDAAAELRVRAAQALSTAGRRLDAIRILQSAWGRGSSAPALLSELGELLVREQRFEEALAVFTDAAQRSEDDPGLWEMVGELRAAMGEPDKALEAWRASLKVKDRAVVRLGIARLHHSREELAAGRRELDRALEVATGGDAWEMRELARTLQLFGRDGDALAILEVLVSEPGQEKDVALQLETARLAHEVGGRAETVRAACSRAQRADATVTRCP
ncbi:MAG: tetratricopeptide repeat protein, partial [Myxococcaceae bacterium]